MKLKTNYIVFWLGQAVSQLGSSMTTFALTIWVYEQSKSAMTVSFMAFCSYVPYILVSIFAGTFVDRVSKKKILIVSDTLAAVCTISILFSVYSNHLTLTQVYIVNVLIGFMNAFQSPAAAVFTGLLITDGNYEKISGLNSFSSNLIQVVSPVISGFLVGICGIFVVLAVDLVTFLFCMGTMLFLKVEEKTEGVKRSKTRLRKRGREELAFLRKEKGIFHLMLHMALLNFFSRLTYENILSPMILARSGGNTAVFGLVSGVLGIGGILGGLMVTVRKCRKKPHQMIYLSAGISFLLGDLFMGAGRNGISWSVAGFFASFPIPFVMAGQSTLLYRSVPKHIQGRIFAIRNGIQYSTIPAGLLLGGYLADHVFEPFMASDQKAAVCFQYLTGKGPGSGMAVMFLCTGILGALSSAIGYRNRAIRELENRFQ